MTKTNSHIILYISQFCGHSWAVERFMKDNEIPVKLIDIDGNPEARQEVMKLNNGYASVPTLIFPDGAQLTEPSFAQLRAKLGIKTPGLMDRVRGLFGRDDQ